MKSTMLNFVATTITFALLVTPTLVGQAQESNAVPTYYFVRNLGTLGGNDGSAANSVDDHGWVAGVANLTGDTEEHAALWQGGVFEISSKGAVAGFLIRHFDVGIVRASSFRDRHSLRRERSLSHFTG